MVVVHLQKWKCCLLVLAVVSLPSYGEGRWFLRGLAAEIEGSHMDEDNALEENMDLGCLEDPSRIDCRRRKRNYDEPSSNILYPLQKLEDWSSGIFQHKKDFVRGQDDTKFDSSDYVVSSAPTRDMCYGNMQSLAYKKYCHSEMPSVSLEPSREPSLSPMQQEDNGTEPTSTFPPSPSPSVLPSRIPSISNGEEKEPSSVPAVILGMCQGDCDSPSDCVEGLICWNRMSFEATPGCPGTEMDGSRTDYCTDATLSAEDPARPGTEDDFRLKLYWNETYFWQESHEEIEWCMACPSSPNGNDEDTSHHCQPGDALFLQYCSSTNSVVYFDFVPLPEESVLIQVVNSTLCLEREGSSEITVAHCNTNNPLQQWTNHTSQTVENESASFELSPASDVGGLCVTTHHHPKHGEEVELYSCDLARRDNTSLWVTF